MKKQQKLIFIAIILCVILAIFATFFLIFQPKDSTIVAANEETIVDKDVWSKDASITTNKNDSDVNIDNLDFNSAFANPKFEKVIESAKETTKTAPELPKVPTQKESETTQPPTTQTTQAPPQETTHKTYSYGGGSSSGTSGSNQTYSFGGAGTSSGGTSSNYTEDGSIASTASSNSSAYGGYISSIVSAVNSYRGGGLSNDTTLNNIAMFRAAEAAASGNTGANRPGGKTLQNLAGYYGLSYTTIGNCIGLFDLNSDNVIAALRSSSSASNTINNSSMSRIGVGIAPYGGNYIWVLVVSN